MDGAGDELALAVLLERAYRLALAVQEGLPCETTVAWRASHELVDVLDDARVSLLQAALRRAAHLNLAGTPPRS